eukprot:scaffold227277_cov37-Tisochrysis_lutea.AAC.4
MGCCGSAAICLYLCVPLRTDCRLACTLHMLLWPRFGPICPRGPLWTSVGPCAPLKASLGFHGPLSADAYPGGISCNPVCPRVPRRTLLRYRVPSCLRKPCECPWAPLCAPCYSNVPRIVRSSLFAREEVLNLFGSESGEGGRGGARGAHGARER